MTYSEEVDELKHALDVVSRFCEGQQLLDCDGCHIGKTCMQYLPGITLDDFSQRLKKEVGE